MTQITKQEIDNGIFVLHNVLSVEECQELIDQSEMQGYDEATVFNGSQHVMLKGVRNNLRVISDDYELAHKLWNRVGSFFTDSVDGFKAYGLNERFRFYKYEKGHRFKKHKDGAFIRDKNDTSIYTFIIYLNENFVGGSTDFEEYSIAPQTGSALVFLHPIKHTGTEVLSGTKYAIRSDVMYLKKS